MIGLSIGRWLLRGEVKGAGSSYAKASADESKGHRA